MDQARARPSSMARSLPRNDLRRVVRRSSVSLDFSKSKRQTHVQTTQARRLCYGLPPPQGRARKTLKYGAVVARQRLTSRTFLSDRPDRSPSPPVLAAPRFSRFLLSFILTSLTSSLIPHPSAFVLYFHCPIEMYCCTVCNRWIRKNFRKNRLIREMR
jgi:hypothetical protein